MLCGDGDSDFYSVSEDFYKKLSVILLAGNTFPPVGRDIKTWRQKPKRILHLTTTDPILGEGQVNQSYDVKEQTECKNPNIVDPGIFNGNIDAFLDRIQWWFCTTQRKSKKDSLPIVKSGEMESKHRHVRFVLLLLIQSENCLILTVLVFYTHTLNLSFFFFCFKPSIIEIEPLKGVSK